MTTDAIIDSIYEAAVLPELWSGVLDAIGRRLSTKGGLLFANTPDGTRWIGGGEAVGIMQEFMAAGWMEHNDRPRRLIEKAHPGFITELDVMTEEETYTLPIFRDFLRPRGAFAAAGTYVTGLDEDKMLLTIEGFASHQAARAAVPYLDELRPHLARAAMLAGRYRLERVRGYVEALEALGAAACVVNTRATLQAVNTRFLQEVGRTVFDLRSGIKLVDPVANRLLQATLAAIRAGAGSGRSVALRGEAPRVLHVLPVSRGAQDLFAGSLAILVITNPQRSLKLPVPLLQGLFDLTPAECRVASRLAAGADLGEIAREGGVSIHTVRVQLRSVLQKTGAERQADLVRLLLSATLV